MGFLPFLSYRSYCSIHFYLSCHLSSSMLSWDRLWWQLFPLKGRCQFRTILSPSVRQTAHPHVYGPISQQTATCALVALVPELPELRIKAGKSRGEHDIVRTAVILSSMQGQVFMVPPWLLLNSIWGSPSKFTDNTTAQCMTQNTISKQGKA